MYYLLVLSLLAIWFNNNKGVSTESAHTNRRMEESNGIR